MANGFAAVSRLLLTHIQDAEKRCRAFEKESGMIKGVMRALTAEQQTQGCAAAARWWWNEYTSLRDAVMSLIDGKIRHEYDRSKAERTPNEEGIHWQKASLRTGESQDNLRRLLKTAGRKHEGEFDAVNLRIEDLQETIKRLRESLVQALRGSRVNKFGEETQELRLKLRGGGGKELRLLPPCGNGLEDCACGESPLPPSPVRDGSLRDLVDAAVEAAASAAAATSEDDAELPVSSRVQPAGNACRGGSGGDGDVSPRAAAAGRKAKRRRVSHGTSSVDRDDGAGRPGSGRAPRAAPSPTSASDVPLDEIKRQMGKNPLDLERRKRALEEETRADPSSHGGGGGGGGGAFRKLLETSAGFSNSGEERENEALGEAGVHGGSGGAREDERSAGRGEDGEEESPDWRDGLIGLEPHEKAAAFEAQERFAEALRWHRKDLDDARSRALDGEQEDERASALDLARALRNTGRCLGRLGNSGFAESKKLLTEACELVGHGGPFPSAAEEQDVVLELGNLWYNRYCLLSDEQVVCFLADEALDEALRFYGESRELCVDLVAESGEGGAGDGRTTGQAPPALGEDETGSTAAAAAASAAAIAGCLLRAEFNVGMSLFEQEKHAEAEPHLAAAARIFRELFAEGARASETGRRCGSGEAGVGASAMSSWKAAVPAREELAGLGAVYASSLSLLGSCLLASCAPSTPTPAAPSGRAGREEEALRRRAVETLEASVEAFLEIDDRARAMEPLLRLVEALGLSPDDESDRRLSVTEGLYDRVSSGLPLSPPPGEAPEAEEDEDLDYERSQLEQIREAIAGLRARGAKEAVSGGESEGGRGATESSGRAQQVQQRRQRHEHGDSARGGNTGPSSPTPEFGRVGPVPTAGFALRRHRSRTAAAAAAASARNTAAAVGRRGASSSTAIASSRKRYRTTGAPAVAASAGGGGRRGGAGDADGLGLAAGGDGGGVGSARTEHLGRGREGGPPFARLRAAVALEDGMAALTAARGPRREGKGGGEPGPPGRESLFDSYRVKCDYFQENPNPLAAARLALADRETGVSSATSTTSNGPGNDSNASVTPCPPVEPRQGTLDLAACRLTDRELRVLLHVVSKWCADDRSAGGSSAAAAAGGATSGEDTTTARSSGPPVGFSELLLGGNPGIGAGALRELWGGSGGSRAVKGPKSLGLLRSLVRLDLSRCGLTAADLAGFASKSSGGRGGPSSTGEAPAVVCLRVVVLRDNPLTRIREASAGLDGTQSWIEPARRGTAALRDLVARSPALELLDLSGCSQVPDGPAARLYSPQVSRLLASALSAGLEARISGKLAAGADCGDGAVSDERGSDGDRHGNRHGGINVAGGPDEGWGRAQVATLRLGGNRFFRSSWRRLLEPLSSHPPCELDLSFATVLPRCSTAAGSVNATGGGGGGGGGESPVAGRGDAAVSVSTAVGGAAEGAMASPLEACLESGDGPAPSMSQAAPAQSLGELLAAAVLPADAPGLETLDLTGSTGLLLVEDGPSHRGSEDDASEVEEPLPFSASPSSSSTEAFLLLLRDALASPLCRTMHLLLSGIRGSPARPGSTAAAASSCWLRPPSAFLPRHVESLCEAASTCASLRCLDLAGCDLSGPVGAAAAAAAVACLIRSEEEEDSVADTQDIGFDTAVSVDGGGLDRLSLRACGLGARGLSAVVRTLVASPENDRGPGRRRKGPLPRFPGVLDLSDNRPLRHGACAAGAAERAPDAGGAARAEEGEAAALTELAGLVRSLEAEGLVSVVVTRDPRRPIGRPRASSRSETALVDLSGNRLDS